MKRFRLREFLKRVLEWFLSSVMMFLLIEQYAIPILKNSVVAVDSGKYISFAKNFNKSYILLVERILKLSVVSVLIWLLMFYSYFHSLLNALAEIMRFGDRRFYMPWWNAVPIFYMGLIERFTLESTGDFGIFLCINGERGMCTCHW